MYQTSSVTLMWKFSGPIHVTVTTDTERIYMYLHKELFIKKNKHQYKRNEGVQVNQTLHAFSIYRNSTENNFEKTS